MLDHGKLACDCDAASDPSQALRRNQDDAMLSRGVPAVYRTDLSITGGNFMASAFSVQDHLHGREAVVASIYEALTKAATKLGPFKAEAKKTSIHLVRSTAFAGVATRKASLILTLKASRDIRSSRVSKHEQVSASRWHLEVRLNSPRDVDAEVRAWLKDAYQLSG